jgi:bifunctional non-homologous end joining protein LigD
MAMVERRPFPNRTGVWSLDTFHFVLPHDFALRSSTQKKRWPPYRSDRNEAWLKIKTVQKGKFPVIGFVKDPTGVAALYLGKKEGKDLVYMGKVGTGWSQTVSSQIRKQLDTVVSPKSKLTKPIRKPKATWVEPTFVADVEYRDITSEGLLRASSFKGLSRK